MDPFSAAEPVRLDESLYVEAELLEAPEIKICSALLAAGRILLANNLDQVVRCEGKSAEMGDGDCRAGRFCVARRGHAEGWMFCLGLIAMVLFIFVETSVASGGDMGRVVNIGLSNQRLVRIIASGGMAVMGAVFLAAHGRRMGGAWVAAVKWRTSERRVDGVQCSAGASRYRSCSHGPFRLSHRPLRACSFAKAKKSSFQRAALFL